MRCGPRIFRKADLATQMVVEMTSLQGVVGRYYAIDSGESKEVARAIFEHYLPRSAEDALPESPAGIAVALADRLDSLTGLFAAGLAPTGTRDPFALRRAALGVIQILLSARDYPSTCARESGWRPRCSRSPFPIRSRRR